MIDPAEPGAHWGRSGAGALVWLAVAARLQVASAQVVLDGKLGPSGPIPGGNYAITAEMGTLRGNNLFHSFQQFDLKKGEVATFSGPAQVQNVLSRVTSGSASSIDGTIKSAIPGANFFLINPSGLVFGPNARVDVGGAFAAGTADYLKLADGVRFAAALDADDSKLTTAPVSAFGFLGQPTGSVEVNQSTLRGARDQTLTLVGGDVTLEGASVQLQSGQVNVVSVRSAGEVPVDPSILSRAEFKAAFPEQGEIRLRSGAQLNVNGTGGGRVVIRGGRLVMENSRIEANTTGAGNGRGIDIAMAQDVQMGEGGQINSLSPSGQGASGDIRVSADSLRLGGDGSPDEFFNPTQISTSTGHIFTGGGTAKGGNISIQAREIELANSAQISSASFGSGDAGRIEIEANSIRLDAGVDGIAQITANTQLINRAGRAGDIVVRTDSLDMLNGATILATSFGSGAAGVIDIGARNVRLRSGAIITAATFGSGRGGNVQLRAESLRIDGQNLLSDGPDLLTGIQAVTTWGGAAAPGGNIQITAETVEMNRHASIFTTSSGLGKGGDIEIAAGDLTLANGSTITAAGESKGPAGRLAIHAARNLAATGGSAITTSAPESSGGDVRVTAGSELRLVGSEINARAGLDGGNITVSAPRLIYLLNSMLTGQADTTDSGFGNGGNLTIEPSAFLILNEGSLISKSSFGNGGNISIMADYFFLSASLIDASAPFGLPGTVQVSAPDVDLSGSLVGLPGNLADAEAQLRPDCVVRLVGNLSSFMVLGRGGLPIQPGGFLPSSLIPVSR